MSAVSWTVYAPTHRKGNWKSPDIDWTKVKRLQMRIAKAVEECGW